MQENRNNTLLDEIDKIHELNDILKYVFVSDRALAFAMDEGLLELNDREIAGMGAIKDMVLDKFLNLENSLIAIFKASK